jgi:DNA-binding winged helix-turn-helix (wHTH) protein
MNMTPSVRLGDADFDSKTGELFRRGSCIRLEPQPAAVLALLIARAGELVSHDELRRAIWGESTHVNFQQSLHYCIRQIRIALDAGAGGPSIVQTIPRRGYRLSVPLTTVAPAVAHAPTSPGSWTKRGATRFVYAALAAVLIVGTVMVERRPNRHHEWTVRALNAVHGLVY